MEVLLYITSMVCFSNDPGAGRPSKFFMIINGHHLSMITKDYARRFSANHASRPVGVVYCEELLESYQEL